MSHSQSPPVSRPAIHATHLLWAPPLDRTRSRRHIKEEESPSPPATPSQQDNHLATQRQRHSQHSLTVPPSDRKMTDVYAYPRPIHLGESLYHLAPCPVPAGSRGAPVMSQDQRSNPSRSNVGGNNSNHMTARNMNPLQPSYYYSSSAGPSRPCHLPMQQQQHQQQHSGGGRSMSVSSTSSSATSFSQNSRSTLMSTRTLSPASQAAIESASGASSSVVVMGGAASSTSYSPSPQQQLSQLAVSYPSPSSFENHHAHHHPHHGHHRVVSKSRSPSSSASSTSMIAAGATTPSHYLQAAQIGHGHGHVASPMPTRAYHTVPAAAVLPFHQPRVPTQLSSSSGTSPAYSYYSPMQQPSPSPSLHGGSGIITPHPHYDMSTTVYGGHHFGSPSSQMNQMNNLAQLRLQTYSPRPSRLQQLPIHILLEIQKHLGYLGSISLKCVNRYFKEIIDPTLCSVDDKIEGVMYAEQNFRQHYPGRLSALPAGDERRGKREWELKNPGNFGCYHCFRVLAPEQFELFKWNITVDRTEDSNEDEGAVQLNIDSLAPNHHHSSSSLSGTPERFGGEGGSGDEQWFTASALTAASGGGVGMGMGMGMGIGGSATGTTATACLTGADYCISPRVKSTWGVRRFCIPCGIRLKFYKPGDLIYLQRASRDQAAWICHCWKTHVRPAELSCQDCGSFVPLSTPTRRRS